MERSMDSMNLGNSSLPHCLKMGKDMEILSDTWKVEKSNGSRYGIMKSYGMKRNKAGTLPMES